MKTGCVWESTKPGKTTRPRQSSSIIFLRFFLSQGSRRASFVVPTETIFPARQSTAADSRIPRSERAGPRRGPGATERIVRSCLMLSNSSGLALTQSPYCIHHIRVVISSEKSAVRKAAELRSAWTGEGARPHTNFPTTLRERPTTSDQLLATSHRHLHARLLRKLFRLVIPRIHMPNHAHARIGRQHALDALGHHVGAVGDRDLPSVQRVADAHAAAVVDRDPRRARRSIHQRIQQRPVGHRVRAIFHAFGFAKRRSHRATIQVIAPKHDGSFDRAFSHQLVNRQAEPRAFTVSKP